MSYFFKSFLQIILKIYIFFLIFRIIMPKKQNILILI